MKGDTQKVLRRNGKIKKGVTGPETIDNTHPNFATFPTDALQQLLKLAGNLVIYMIDQATGSDKMEMDLDRKHTMSTCVAHLKVTNMAIHNTLQKLML